MTTPQQTLDNLREYIQDILSQYKDDVFLSAAEVTQTKAVIDNYMGQFESRAQTIIDGTYELSQKVGLVDEFADSLNNKAEKTHTHTSSNIIDAGSEPSSGTIVRRESGGFFSVNTPTLTAHPTTKGYVDAEVEKKSNLDHEHEISQVVGLEQRLASSDQHVSTELAKKASLLHTHTLEDVAGLTLALEQKAGISHGHSVSEVADLQNLLDGKSNNSHTHLVEDVEGLTSALEEKADVGFGDVVATHVSGDFNNLDLSQPGLYRIRGGTGHVTNMPVSTAGVWYNVILLDTMDSESSNTKLFLAHSATNDVVYVKTRSGLTWSSWVAINDSYSSMSVDTATATPPSTTSGLVSPFVLQGTVRTLVTGSLNGVPTSIGHDVMTATTQSEARTAIGAKASSWNPSILDVTGLQESLDDKATNVRVNLRPATFAGEGPPPEVIEGAVAGDWYHDTTDPKNIKIYRITGV